MGLDNIQNYMIGVILAVVVIVSGVFMVGSLAEYKPSLNNDGELAQFNKTFNKASEITESVNKVDNSIQSVGQENTGVLGWLNALVGSAYNGLKSLGITLGFVNDAATEGGAYYHVPPAITALVLLVIVVVIAFSIWAAITKT